MESRSDWYFVVVLSGKARRHEAPFAFEKTRQRLAVPLKADPLQDAHCCKGLIFILTAYIFQFEIAIPIFSITPAMFCIQPYSSTKSFR